METVLVAGATGRLGIEVARELKARGHRVRALVRSPRRAEALRGLADEVHFGDALRAQTIQAAVRGVDRVFSCLGASVIPIPCYGKIGFSQHDWPANRNLVDAAQAASVRKFVYISVFGHDRLPRNDFIRGHEAVVGDLRNSGLDYSVLRPTGFFSSMEEILLVASRGLLPEFAGGRPRTNPIHEADLAVACVDAFDRPSGWEQDLGGPDPLTRKEIAQLAWDAIGRKGREVRVPVGVLRNSGRLVYPLNPRVGSLMIFISHILTEDFVAPCYGTRRIADYFAERAAVLNSKSQPT